MNACVVSGIGETSICVEKYWLSIPLRIPSRGPGIELDDDDDEGCSGCTKWNPDRLLDLEHRALR